MVRHMSQGQHISSSTKVMNHLTKDFLNSRYNTNNTSRNNASYTSNLHKNHFSSQGILSSFVFFLLAYIREKKELLFHKQYNPAEHIFF